MRTANAAIRLTAFTLLLFAAGPVRSVDNLFTTPDAAARAASEIAAKIGSEPSVSLIEIGPNEIRLNVQGEKSFHVNEWRWGLVKYWLLERSFVSGPHPVGVSGPVDDVATSFFPLSEVALDRVPEVVAAAIARAGLEDNAEVDRIRIERSVSIFPRPHFGDPRWAVSVTSGRERATVFAALDGTITGANLSGTQRARMLNLLADDSHLDEAEADLAAVLGPAVRMRELSVSGTGISARTEHPEKSDRLLSYRWNLNGVRRDPIDSPAFARTNESKEDPAFAFSDLDFAVLPELKTAALDKLAMERGTIAGMKAAKRITGLRPAELVWIVDVEDAKGEKGQVIADTRGVIIEVLEPESRRPKQEWLDGAAIRSTLDRIFENFPDGTNFSSILINDTRAHVEAEDPLKPGEMVTFIVDAQTIRPWGRPFPHEAFGMGSPAKFTAEDMKGYDAGILDTLKQRTLERVNLPDGRVFRLTFERGNVFVASPHGQVLVEIRVDGPDGRGGGRVTYEPDGTELDAVLP